MKFDFSHVIPNSKIPEPDGISGSDVVTRRSAESDVWESGGDAHESAESGAAVVEEGSGGLGVEIGR